MAAEEPASSWEEAATALPSWQQQQRQAMQPITNQQHVAAGQSQQTRQQSFVSTSAASPAEPVWDSREQFQMRPKPPAAAAAGSKRKSSGGGSSGKKAAKPAPPAQRISRFFAPRPKQA
jgi:hypothetical protein